MCSFAQTNHYSRWYQRHAEGRPFNYSDSGSIGDWRIRPAIAVRTNWTGAGSDTAGYYQSTSTVKDSKWRQKYDDEDGNQNNAGNDGR